LPKKEAPPVGEQVAPLTNVSQLTAKRRKCK